MHAGLARHRSRNANERTARERRVSGELDDNASGEAATRAGAGARDVDAGAAGTPPPPGEGGARKEHGYPDPSAAPGAPGLRPPKFENRGWSTRFGQPGALSPQGAGRGSGLARRDRFRRELMAAVAKSG